MWLYPAHLREALRLEPGCDLIAFIEAEQLVLRPRKIAESEWAMFSGVENSLSRELVQERRAEAERENRAYSKRTRRFGSTCIFATGTRLRDCTVGFDLEPPIVTARRVTERVLEHDLTQKHKPGFLTKSI